MQLGLNKENVSPKIYPQFIIFMEYATACFQIASKLLPNRNQQNAIKTTQALVIEIIKENGAPTRHSAAQKNTYKTMTCACQF